MRFFQGVCLDQLGRPEEAESAILEALEAGFRPGVQRGCPVCQPRAAAHQRSPASYPHPRSLRPQATDPKCRGLGHAWASTPAKAQFALALSAFNQSLAIDPLQPETLALRGSLLRRFGDLQAAAADYSSALNLDPDNYPTRYALGLVHLQRGQLEQALHCIQTASAALDDPGQFLLTALLAYAIGEPNTAADALDHYFRHAAADPNESAYYLEYLLGAKQQPTDALQRLHDHAGARSGSDELGYFLAYCQGLKSRKDLLDLAGHASTPEQARKQLCEATFWMAQQQRLIGNTGTARVTRIVPEHR